jgi:hypothetical protein
MDKLYPFSEPSSKERQEIRNCAKIFFYGGNPSSLEETKDAWSKWQVFFNVFLMIRDARYGNLIHLPFNVSAFDQPHRTMKVIQQIQSLYQEKIEEDTRKAFKQ